MLWTEWRDGRWELFEYSLADIRMAFAREAVGYWIRSAALPRDLPGGGGGDAEPVTAGLIIVQPGLRRDGRIEDASISIVDRIRDTETGEERRYDEYRRIYERLRRSMRKRLVVQTAYTYPDGSVGVSWPMTARSADAHVRGDVRFRAAPVNLHDRT